MTYFTSCLPVVHLVPYPGIELVWIRLSCLVELERNLSVNAKRKIVVDHIDGKVVLATFLCRLEISVPGNLQSPPVELYLVSILKNV